VQARVGLSAELRASREVVKESTEQHRERERAAAAITEMPSAASSGAIHNCPSASRIHTPVSPPERITESRDAIVGRPAG
jgi:hypothetical protein